MIDIGPQPWTKTITKNRIYAMLFDTISVSLCFNEKGHAWVYCNEPALHVVNSGIDPRS